MATVPGSGDDRIVSRPLTPVYQSENAPASAFGSDGRALMQAGARISAGADQLAQVVAKEQEEDNIRELKNLDIKRRQFVLTTLNGDGSEENPGYFSTQQENALSGAETAQKALEDHRQSLLASASNDRVRQDFDMLSQSDQLQDFQGIANHVRVQRTAANDAASSARKELAMQQAAVAWNDPEALAAAVATVNGENFDEKNRKGYSDDVLKFNIARDQSLLYAGAIKAALAQDPAAAQALFDRVSPALDPTTRLQLKNVLEEVGLVEQAQTYAEQFLAEAGGNYTRARQLAREQLKGKTEAETVQELNARMDEQWQSYVRGKQYAQDKTEAETKALKDVSLAEATNYLKAAETPAAAIEALKADYSAGDWTAPEYDAILARLEHEKTYQQQEIDRADRLADETAKELAAQEKAEITERERKATEASISLNAHVIGGGSVADWAARNPDAYLDLQGGSKGMELLDNARDMQNDVAEGKLHAPISDAKTLQAFKGLTPDQQVAFDLTTIQLRLTKRELEEAQRVQLQAKDAIAQAQSASGGAYSAINGIVAALAPKTLGKNKKKIDVLSPDQLNLVNTDLRDWVSKYTAKGKPVAEADLRRVATSLLMARVTDTRGWDTEMPLAKFASENDMRPAEVLAILERMKAAGRENDWALLERSVELFKSGDVEGMKKLWSAKRE